MADVKDFRDEIQAFGDLCVPRAASLARSKTEARHAAEAAVAAGFNQQLPCASHT